MPYIIAVLSIVVWFLTIILVNLRNECESLKEQCERLKKDRDIYIENYNFVNDELCNMTGLICDYFGLDIGEEILKELVSKIDKYGKYYVYDPLVIYLLASLTRKINKDGLVTKTTLDSNLEGSNDVFQLIILDKLDGNSKFIFIIDMKYWGLFECISKGYDVYVDTKIQRDYRDIVHL